MAQEQPNWVAERAKCSITLLFNELRALVKQDTEWAGIESDKNKRSRTYLWTVGESSCRIKRQESGGAEEECSFRCKVLEGLVHVSIFSPSSSVSDQGYTIKTRWDAESCQCLLVVRTLQDEKQKEFPHYELWKALQYILEPFFFSKEDE